MQRREFFQTGALGMATLLARGAQGSTDIRLSASQMDQFLLQLDKKQALMANTLAEGFLGAPVAAADPAERARCLTLLRKVLRSMHLTRSFRDLPEHGRAHPGMQRRMAAALPEIDEAVSGARSFLFELSPADRLDLQRTIVQNPELLPKMASHV